MAVVGLTDLESIVSECREDETKELVREAIGCYHAGSVRSAIVMTWIAVVLDLTLKLRRLAMLGDKGAVKFVAKLDALLQANDVAGLQALERKMLDVARDDFQLIGHLEHEQLGRLYGDRHRCAHPSLSGDWDEIFRPAPELARLHIVNSANATFSRDPVQGKAALDRLLDQVDSEYFPTEPAGAKALLEASPLREPRDALLRNFCLVMLKVLLDPDRESGHARYAAALCATISLHRHRTEALIRELVPSLIDALPDERLLFGVGACERVPEIKASLSDSTVSKLTSYVRGAPDGELDELLDVVSDESDFYEALAERLTNARKRLVLNLSVLHPRRIIIPAVIRKWQQAEDFTEANSIARSVVIPLAPLMQPSDIELIARAFRESSEIPESFGLDEVVNALVLAHPESADEFIAAVERVAGTDALLMKIKQKYLAFAATSEDDEIDWG